MTTYIDFTKDLDEDGNYKELEYEEEGEQSSEKKKEEEPSKFYNSGIYWKNSELRDKELRRYNASELKLCQEEEYQSLFIFLNGDKKIKGKLQSISEVKKTIPLITKCKKVKGADINYSYKFFGDSVDSRYDGYTVDTLTKDFYIYRLREKDEDKEYFVLSEYKLEPQEYTLTGAIIKLNSRFDLSKDFKLGNVASVFIVKSYCPAVKILPKTELISFIKNKKLTYEEFRRFMNWHPIQQKIFLQEPKFDKLNYIQLLSSETENYGLNMLGLSCPGTGKTTILESFLNRFGEPIFEAGNSTLKGLIPSFKESIPKLGYLIEANRFGGVDELMKLVENTLRDSKMHEVKGMFSPLNMILTRKKRVVGSGTYSSETMATGKFMFYGNPVSRKRTLYENIKYLDNSTISRILIFCLDKEILKARYESKPIKHKKDNFCICNNDFLTIYDSCQKILSEYDEDRLKELFNNSVSLAKDDMKSAWSVRGEHHSILILDGIVKLRCLFSGDVSFKAIEADYAELEYYLTRIVKSWDTDLSKTYVDYLEEEKFQFEELILYFEKNKNKVVSKRDLEESFIYNKEKLDDLMEKGLIFKPKSNEELYQWM